jgi:hypothetical protein
VASDDTPRGKAARKPRPEAPPVGQPEVSGGSARGKALPASRPTPASRPEGDHAAPGRAGADPTPQAGRGGGHLAMALTAPVAEAPTYEPPNVPGWPWWATVFLKHYSQVGVIDIAAPKTPISGMQVNRLKRLDPVFKEEMHKAKGVATWEAEKTFRQRAMGGWTETQVRYDGQGNEVEKIVKEKFHPGMLIRLMEVNYPERWSRKQEITTRNENITVITGELQKRITSDPKLAALICQLDEALAAPPAPPVTQVEALPSPEEAPTDGEG